MKIKDWEKHQHYKKRCPPWIKLHRDILETRSITELSDLSFRVLIGLWLLASESEAMNGTLPPVDDIAYRLRIPSEKVKDCLSELSSFLVQDDSKVIALRKHETRLETEAEAKQRQIRGKARSEAKAAVIEDAEAPF